VIDAQTWKIVATDQKYSDQSDSAAFGPDGVLYTVAEDGKIRQYGSGPPFAKQREVKTRGGPHPIDIAVDPRGELIAVGFYDSTRIDFYDAASLKLLRAVECGVEFEFSTLRRTAAEGLPQ
jgi:hypothetical protein